MIVPDLSEPRITLIHRRWLALTGHFSASAAGMVGSAIRQNDQNARQYAILSQFSIAEDVF